MKWKNGYFRTEFTIPTFRELFTVIINKYFMIGTFLGTIMSE